MEYSTHEQTSISSIFFHFLKNLRPVYSVLTALLMIVKLGAAAEYAENKILLFFYMLMLITMLYWPGGHVHALMFAGEYSQCSDKSDYEPLVYNPTFATAVTNCISVGHPIKADQDERVADTNFETFTGFESVKVKNTTMLMQGLQVVLIAESEIPWILHKVVLRLGIVFLSGKSSAVLITSRKRACSLDSLFGLLPLAKAEQHLPRHSIAGVRRFAAAFSIFQRCILFSIVWV